MLTFFLSHYELNELNEESLFIRLRGRFSPHDFTN
jgi:hypothetical protein